MQEDGPPQLQDFEEDLKKINTSKQTTSSPGNPTQDYTIPNVRHIEDEKKKAQMIQQTNTQAQKLQAQLPKPQEIKKQQYGGMKKGFFSSGPSTAPKTTQVKPINKNKNPLQIKQVQQAMKMNDYLNNTRNQWMDNNFLDQVSNNQKISKLFSNPEYMQAMDLFQKNPQQAMIKYGGNKELMDCFQEFCKMMGMRFTEMSQEAKNKQK